MRNMDALLYMSLVQYNIHLGYNILVPSTNIYVACYI
jgi:hypothetical protein